MFENCNSNYINIIIMQNLATLTTLYIIKIERKMNEIIYICLIGITDRHITLEDHTQWLTSDIDNCSCCCEQQQGGGDQWPDDNEKWQRFLRARRFLRSAGSCCVCTFRCVRRWIKKLVEHKYFQQGILLAILINTLSMGIEYHNQVVFLSVNISINIAILRCSMIIILSFND